MPAELAPYLTLNVVELVVPAVIYHLNEIFVFKLAAPKLVPQVAYIALAVESWKSATVIRFEADEPKYAEKSKYKIFDALFGVIESVSAKSPSVFCGIVPSAGIIAVLVS